MNIDQVLKNSMSISSEEEYAAFISHAPQLAKEVIRLRENNKFLTNKISELKKLLELDLQVDNSTLRIPPLVLPLHEDAIDRAKEQITPPSRVEDLSGNGNHAYVYPNDDTKKLKKLLKWALNEIDEICDFPTRTSNEPPAHDCDYIYRPDGGYCEFCEKYWEAKEAVGDI